MAFNDTFVVVGGSEHPKSVYIYHYRKDSWTELEAVLGIGREEVTAMAVKRSMFPKCEFMK